MKIIILAGGSGKRLWPYSNSERPKQFLPLFEGRSLFHLTIKRWLNFFSPDDVLIVSGQDYAVLIEEELFHFDPRLQKKVLLEPAAKNTLPAICYALKFLEKSKKLHSEEQVLVVPSDHLLSPEQELGRGLQEGRPLAADRQLVLFGITPTRPETGYGYIHPTTHSALRFVEKPSVQEATAFLSQGGYLWNSGMILFQVCTFWTEIHTHCPEFDAFFKQSFESTIMNYAELPCISLDYALLEKSKSCRVIPLHLHWQDVGSWDAIYDIEKKDEKGNVFKGDVQSLDCKNTLVYAESKPISIIGMEDVLVVDSKEGILIVKKGHAQKVKHL